MTPALRSELLLADQPEVFLSSAETSRLIRSAVKAGTARKLGPRLYTKNTSESLEQVARRNWQRIVGLLFPGAVVVDRTAFEAKPSTDGSVFLDVGERRARREAVTLPGLTLRPRPGPGPVEGDMPFMDGLNFSGPGRKFLDNMRRSRRAKGVARTLSPAELEEELSRMISLRGEESLNELRDTAREVAPSLAAESEMVALDDLIGALLGTRDAALATQSGRAHRRGEGFDPDRIALFETLQSRLIQDAPLPRRAEQPDSLPALPFIEAYFSNWIEGTEFELAEAEEIVFEGVVPNGRNEDAHDILGTYELVADPAKRSKVPTDVDDLVSTLRSHHGLMLAQRPSARPGSLKDKPNRAGGTSFVKPALVTGTLSEGYRYYEALPAGLSRAIFMMFLISEVHPFTDGNGRVARVLMNAELTASGLQRIVIPLSYRDDYLNGLRALSRTADPRALIRVLDHAQEYAAEIDWSDLRKVREILTATNAFVPPEEAEATGKRLRLPSTMPAEVGGARE